MAELENTATEQTEVNETAGTETDQTNGDTSAELARLRAEIARSKAALDKATKEAGDAKKALRAKQTAEEAAAETEKEQRETMMRELEELRKERAVAVTSKRVYTFVQNEDVANSIASALYGAEDVDAAIDAINKAWVAKEKALKLEYGKVPAPGTGSSDGPTITKEQLNAMSLRERTEYARSYPDDYNKLMGR